MFLGSHWVVDGLPIDPNIRGGEEYGVRGKREKTRRVFGLFVRFQTLIRRERWIKFGRRVVRDDPTSFPTVSFFLLLEGKRFDVYVSSVTRATKCT